MNAVLTSIPTAWQEAIGWAILHALWQGALIAAVLAIVLNLIPHRHAHVRYGLAVLALSAMIAWSGATVYQYYYRSVHSGETIESVAGWSVAAEVAPVGGERLAVPQQSGWRESLQTGIQRIEPYLGMIVLGWMLGAVLFGLRWLGSWWVIWRLRNRGQVAAPRRWQDRLHQLARAMGVRRPVQLMESMRVQVPMVIGQLKPVILVPVGFFSGIPVDQVEAVLVHELAHIRRYDYLVNLLQSLVEVVFFYHPAVWWINLVIREEREHCCDDIAVAVCAAPSVYARALANLESRRQDPVQFAMGLGGRKKPLLRRIKRLLTPEQVGSNLSQRSALAVVMLMLAFGLSWFSTWAGLPARPDLPGRDWIVAAVPAPEAPVKPGIPATAPRPVNPAALAEIETGLTRVDTPPPPPPLAPDMKMPSPSPPPPPPLPMLENIGADSFSAETQAALEAELRQYEQAVQETYRNYEQQVREWQWQMQEAEQQMKEAQRQLEEEARRLAEEWERGERAYVEAGEKEVQREELLSLQREQEALLREQERIIRREAERLAREGHRLHEEQARRMREIERQVQAQERQVRAQQERMQRQAERLAREANHRHERMRADLLRQMKRDGLSEGGDRSISLKYRNGKLRVNGKTLAPDMAGPYLDILRRYGMGVDEGSQFSFTFD